MHTWKEWAIIWSSRIFRLWFDEFICHRVKLAHFDWPVFSKSARQGLKVVNVKFTVAFDLLLHIQKVWLRNIYNKSQTRQTLICSLLAICFLSDYSEHYIRPVDHWSDEFNWYLLFYIIFLVEIKLCCWHEDEVIFSNLLNVKICVYWFFFRGLLELFTSQRSYVTRMRRGLIHPQTLEVVYFRTLDTVAYPHSLLFVEIAFHFKAST